MYFLPQFQNNYQKIGANWAFAIHSVWKQQQQHSADLGLSFNLSLSCKLQLIDVITVSATCQQTILVCFFSPRTVKWVCRKRKETIGWKIRKANLVPRMLEMAFQSSKFQNFLGDIPPEPPRLKGPMTPCSYSQVFFPNQLPTSNFIESPA